MNECVFNNLNLNVCLQSYMFCIQANQCVILRHTGAPRIFGTKYLAFEVDCSRPIAMTLCIKLCDTI